MDTVKMKNLLISFAFILTVTGCKTTEPLYYYGDYTTAVYSYLKAEDTTLEEQISALEKTIELAAANGRNIAPGVHAHLGMLYFETGNPQLGASHFEQEKQLFPESSHYIEFLLNSAQGA